MILKITFLNINGFNKSSDQLSRYISQQNIHLICIQETHTIQIQQLSHFSHSHKFLAYPNTDQSLSPQITHRQGTLTLINIQLLKLSPQIITTHTILPNYIQSLSFTLYNMNYTLTVMSSLVSAVSSFIYTELHDSYTTESVSYNNTVIYHAVNHTYETREKKAAETCAMTSHTITTPF